MNSMARKIWVTRIPWTFFVVWLLTSNILVVLWVVSNDSHSDPLLLFPHDPFRLAREQSYGFVEDIPEDEWVEFYQRPARTYQPYRDWQHPNQNSDRPPYWIFHNWDPYFSCPRLRQVAHKYVCDPDRLIRGSSSSVEDDNINNQPRPNSSAPPPCLIYAFLGNRGDDSRIGHPWVDQAAEFFGTKCQIHTFHTNESSSSSQETGRKHVIHHVWNDGAKQQSSLQQIKKQLGHKDQTIDLLFLDCEGCEWRVFDEILALAPMQILLQTHDLPLPDRPKETPKFGVTLPPMAASHLFDAFRAQGYIVFAKRVLSATEECLETDWSFLRFHPSFFLPP